MYVSMIQATNVPMVPITVSSSSSSCLDGKTFLDAMESSTSFIVGIVIG
jgi:hypothetical protein